MGKLKILINDRDIKILEVINKFGYLREDFLAKYLGFEIYDNKVANNLKTLAYRLSKFDFVNREKILFATPSYWSLGKKGAKFIDGFFEKELTLAALKHNDIVASLAINNFIVAKNNNVDFDLLTNLELKRNSSDKFVRKSKFPDLVIDEKIAIEVDISNKIADKIYQLAKDDNRFNLRVFEGINILSNNVYKPLLSNLTDEIN